MKPMLKKCNVNWHNENKQLNTGIVLARMFLEPILYYTSNIFKPYEYLHHSTNLHTLVTICIVKKHQIPLSKRYALLLEHCQQEWKPFLQLSFETKKTQLQAFQSQGTKHPREWPLTSWHPVPLTTAKPWIWQAFLPLRLVDISKHAGFVWPWCRNSFWLMLAKGMWEIGEQKSNKPR